MSALVVHAGAAELGVREPVACVIRGLRGQSQAEGIERAIERFMAELPSLAAEIAARPEVRAFDALFARMGYPNQVPAGRRLISSLLERGFPRYGAIVDAYNLASASSGSGLGMHDAHAVLAHHDEIHVARASGDERITPLFKDKPVRVRAGDLVYGVGESPLRPAAWLGKRDVDSDDFKVTDSTESVVLVALGNDATSEAYNRAACTLAVDLLGSAYPDMEADFLAVVFADGRSPAWGGVGASGPIPARATGDT